MEPIKGDKKMNQHPQKPFQFLFKPTYACNLACKYCYAQRLRDEERRIISDEEVHALFNWALKYSMENGINKAEIVWHGGEPLLPGADFMRRTLEWYTELFSRHGIRCLNRIQTNLLLINQDYIELIKKYFGGQIGFSFDFCSSDRCYSNGKNAEDDIWEKALWARDQGVKIGAICQISSGNASRISEMYAKFKNAKIPFNISRICDVNQTTGLYHNSFTDDEYVSAVCELFDLWYYDSDQQIEIGTFKEYISMLLCNNSTCCCFRRECNLLVFGPHGDIYPCDKFGEDTQKLGNYFTDEPAKIKESRLEFSKNIITRDPLASECSKCDFFKMCHGGCLFDRQTGWRKHECYTNRKIWAHIAKAIENDGAKLGSMAEQDSYGN